MDNLKNRLHSIKNICVKDRVVTGKTGLAVIKKTSRKGSKKIEGCKQRQTRFNPKKN